MDTLRGPCAIADKMVEDPHHVVDCRRRIWVRQDVAERIEGSVPLEGLFVQIGYLLGCSKSERGRLWKLERAAQFSEGDMGVP
jgi:hypothetical protein